MKRNTLKPETMKSSGFFASAAALFVMLFLTFSTTSAQANSAPINQTGLKIYAVGNLIMGIESENQGVSRSSIYYAGLYRIPEAVKPLMERMRNEPDASTKILIALSLFRIGDPEGLDMVQLLAKEDLNPKVRRMCSAIYNEYVSPDSVNYVAR